MIVIYLLMALLGSAATIFALQNRDPVEIWFLAWGVKGMPLALVILLSLLIGVVFTSLTGLVKVLKMRYRIRQLENQVGQLSRLPRHRPTRRRALRRLPPSPAEPGEKEGVACPEALATADPQAPDDAGRGKIYPRSV
jgi:uncharacterized integral membrane protein